MKCFSLGALGFTMIGLTTAAPAVQAAKIYGISEVAGAQRLVTWDSANPSVLLSDVPITGLPPGETIRGMDFEPIYFIPGEQQLFAIGTGSGGFANVYRLDLTGVALKLPAGSSSPAQSLGQISGVTSFGAGTLRSTSDTAFLVGYSTSRNSGSGLGTLSFSHDDANAGQTPRPVHIAENYVVDSNLDLLAIRTPAGTDTSLSTIGPLGLNVDDVGAIDIDAASGVIYAALLPSGQSQSRFYSIDRQTGFATLTGPIGESEVISAIAVLPPVSTIPEPTSLLLFEVACLAIPTIYKRPLISFK